MIELDKNLALEFLQKNNVVCSDIIKVAGDASFRSYYRVFCVDKSYILMFAPPKYEDVKPFIAVDEYLRKNNLPAPEIFHIDETNGFLLLEDFGDVSLTKILKEFPDRELELYKSSIDCLIELHKKENPQQIKLYNSSELLREVFLFIDWYLPLKNKKPTPKEVFAFKKTFLNLFDELNSSCDETKRVVALRDYHADNLMVVNDSEIRLLDFQDALIGSKSYDLVSLIEDARRDLKPENSLKIYDYFLEQSNLSPELFKKEYEILSLQRNIKILGIFARLSKRDGKKRYLDLLPRVEKYVISRLESDSPYLRETSQIIKSFNLF